MIPYKPEMSDEEKANVDAHALQLEAQSAQQKATDDFHKFKQQSWNFGPVDYAVGSVYEVAIWQQDTSQGFWGRFPAVNVQDKMFRVYFHVWSDTLNEAVQVAVVTGNIKDVQRINR